MKKKMINLDKVTKNLICISVIAVLVCCIIPLLLIAQYAFPAADDFAFSKMTFQSVNQGNGILKTLIEAGKTAINFYKIWQGSFAAIFFMALQPGIWGEQYYFITTYIMLGMLIVSELLLGCHVLMKMIEMPPKNAFIVVGAILSMQILFVPTPSQSFYWFNGAVYYTLFYSLLLLFLTCLLKIHACKRHKWLFIFAGSILGIIIGGGNLSTGLLSTELSVIAIVFFIYTNKKKGILCSMPCLLQVIAFMLNVLAPGQSVRMSNSTSKTGIFVSIMLSFKDAFRFFCEWQHVYVVGALLFLIPICIWGLNKSTFSFKVPGIFTVLSICLFTSQFTPIEYAYGGGAPERMLDIIYYSFWILIVINEIYWIGWLGKTRKCGVLFDKLINQNYAFSLIAGVFSVIFLGSLLLGIKSSSSYSAYRSLRNGQADSYEKVLNGRLEVYYDDAIEDAVVEPVIYPPEILFYSDLSTEVNDWENITIAEYYGKNTISLKRE